MKIKSNKYVMSQNRAPNMILKAIVSQPYILLALESFNRKSTQMIDMLFIILKSTRSKSSPLRKQTNKQTNQPRGASEFTSNNHYIHSVQSFDTLWSPNFSHSSKSNTDQERRA